MVILKFLLSWLGFCLWNTNCELLNQYESDGINYWASLTTFIPIRNATYGQIQIKNKMFFQWDLFWYDVVPNGTDYENIFRIGNAGFDVTSCNEHAHRYPGLYINTNTKKLQIAISDTTDCWGSHYEQIDFTLTPNTKYAFTMQYTQETLVIVCNGIPIYTGNRLGITPNNTLGTYVDIIISDPINTAANCTIDDLLIVSYEHRLSKYPTESPTFSPTFSPTSLLTKPPSNYPSSNTDRPTSIPSISPTPNPILHSTVTIAVSKLYIVDSVIIIKYNDTLMEIDTDVINEIKHTITTLIINHIDSIDKSRLILSAQHGQELTININYETYNKSEANALEIYIATQLAQDLKVELSQNYERNDETMIITITTETTTVTIIDDIDTNVSGEEDNNKPSTSSNEEILWVFNGETIWYLIGSVLVLFIIVIMGCLILLYRYRILLRKTKHSRQSEESLPQIAVEYSNNLSSGIKYHYNKNSAIGYAFKDKKSPSMNNNDDEDMCLVPQQFDVGTSISSTIVSPQLTSKVSVSDLSSMINIEDMNQRKNIKIVQPQYYNQDDNNTMHSNNNTNNNLINPRNSNNSLCTDTSNYEHDYLEKENSDSNESMYDPTLSNSHLERTATATDDGNTND